MSDPYEQHRLETEDKNRRMDVETAEGRAKEQQKLTDILQGSPRPFLSTGELGNETVVIWVMWAAVIGGILTRSVIGIVVCAVLMFLAWFLFKKSFGGTFMRRTYAPSKLTASVLIGAIAGFAAAFVIRHVSVFLCASIGAGLGLAFYQLVLAKHASKPAEPPKH